ncbi:MAG: M20/M25/M40 family metallo-hydrolase [Aigarchaeota archaeon]|nr:M20/M25/M40 family metallo-hydrolase [Aigarchaeota archaeon]MDW8093312.1 M20/M25/M40 family metallo-hydrolase [Nitrososphaerota archaeon]
MDVGTLLFRLLNVYSPSGQESRLEPLMREFSRELAYDEFERDTVGNYVFKKGSGDRVIMLAGHVDTIPGELNVSRSEDSVSGRGAVDAKGPFAAMLKAGSDVEVKNSTLVVMGLVDEEGAGTGALSLLERRPRIDHIIIGEPTGVTGVAISYRGSLTVMISAKGRGGHSSAPYMGDSALDKLLDALYDVRTIFNGRRYEEETSAITVLKAGDWPSKLPEYAEAIVNIRFPPSAQLSNIVSKLESITSLHECTLSVLDSTEPYSSSVSSPVPRALVRGLIMNGQRPKIVKKTGSSDMNVLFKLTRDIAAYGPGNSLLAHTNYEKVSLKDLELAVRVIRSAVSELDRGHLG